MLLLVNSEDVVHSTSIKIKSYRSFVFPFTACTKSVHSLSQTVPLATIKYFLPFLILPFIPFPLTDLTSWLQRFTFYDIMEMCLLMHHHHSCLLALRFRFHIQSCNGQGCKDASKLLFEQSLLLRNAPCEAER